MGTSMSTAEQRRRHLSGRFSPVHMVILLAATLMLVLFIPSVAHGAVTVSRAEVSGGNLRIHQSPGLAGLNNLASVQPFAGFLIGTIKNHARIKVQHIGSRAFGSARRDALRDGAFDLDKLRLRRQRCRLGAQFLELGG